MEITMYHYLFIGLLLFLIGLLGSTLVKNVIKVLISIEIMLLGVNINFEGYIISLFYVGLGAVELAVALYLFYLMYQKKESDCIERFNEL